MKRFMLVAGLTLVVGVSTATAGGGNSDTAKDCQSGWQNLVRQDGTGFKNQGDCVSYGAQGGVPKAKAPITTAAGPSTCTTGSENFSGAAENSQPTTFSGGTIDPAAYGTYGAILISGPYFNGFAQGTHFLLTGWGANSFKLTFTNPVNSVKLQAETNKTSITTQLTLTGYDASNNVVATNSGTDIGSGASSVTPQISSTTNNIKSFTIATDDPNNYGLGFSNIAWGCAA